MATDLDLANVALGMIGQAPLLNLSNTVNSQLIGLVNSFLPIAREEVLRARDWNAARARATLAAVTNDSSEWAYAFRLPADCLAMRRFDSEYDYIKHAKFSVEIDAEDKPVLYTDSGTSKIVYTKNLTDVNRWDALLFHTGAVRLAYYLAGPVVRDHKLLQVKLQELQAAFDEGVGVDETEGGTEDVYSADLVNVRF